MKKIISHLLVFAIALSIFAGVPLIQGTGVANAQGTDQNNVICDCDSKNYWRSHSLYKTTLGDDYTNFTQGTSSIKMICVPDNNSGYMDLAGQTWYPRVGGMLFYTFPNKKDFSSSTLVSFDLFCSRSMTGNHTFQINFISPSSSYTADPYFNIDHDGFNYTFSISGWSAGWHTITVDLSSIKAVVSTANWSDIYRLRFTWFNYPLDPQDTYFLIDNVCAYTGNDLDRSTYKRVKEYCSNVNADSLTKKLESVGWDLSDPADYNEFVSLYNEACLTMKERGDLVFLTTNDLFLASLFNDYINTNMVARGIIETAEVTFNGEALDFKDSEKEKCKDALRDFMQTSYAKMSELEFVSDVSKFLADLCEVIGDSAEAQKIEELQKTISQSKKVKDVETLLYEIDYDKVKGTVVSLKNNHLKNAFSKIGSALKLTQISVEGICNMCQVSSMMEVYKQYEDFLNDTATDVSLPPKMREAASELAAEIGDQYGQIATRLCAETADLIADDLISLAVDKIGSAVFSSVMLGFSIGRFLGNALLGVDKLVQGTAHVMYYAELANKYAKKVLQDKEIFNKNQTYENAKQFKEDYDKLVELRRIGEEKYIEVQAGYGLEKLQKIIREFSNYKGKKEYCDWNLEKIDSCQFSYEEKTSKALKERYLYSNKVMVACPVDVSVYNSEGRLCARTINNEIDYAVIDESTNPVAVYIENETKIIHMNDTDKYRIETSAFDSGEVSFTSYKYNEKNELIDITEYINVSISKGDVLQTTYQENKTNAYSSLYDSEFNAIAPDKSGGIIYGDTNYDGVCNIIDALLTLKKSVDSYEFTEGQFKVSDVNKDYSVTSSDALLILQHGIELIDKFPIEQKTVNIDSFESLDTANVYIGHNSTAPSSLSKSSVAPNGGSRWVELHADHLEGQGSYDCEVFETSNGYGEAPDGNSFLKLGAHDTDDRTVAQTDSLNYAHWAKIHYQTPINLSSCDTLKLKFNLICDKPINSGVNLVIGTNDDYTTELDAYITCALNTFAPNQWNELVINKSDFDGSVDWSEIVTLTIKIDANSTQVAEWGITYLFVDDIVAYS